MIKYLFSIFPVTPDPARQPDSICEYSFGLFKPSADCDIFYYRCAYGEAEEVACEKGLAYDERTHSCNWPDLMIDVGCEPESKSFSFTVYTITNLKGLDGNYPQDLDYIVLK